MSLYEIICSLQNASGNNQKLAIMKEHKENALFKAYMKAVYDVSINYYQKKIPATGMEAASDEFSTGTILQIVENLAERKVTGDNARTWLKVLLLSLNPEGQELVCYIIDRSIGASTGETMVLKTWPDLFFIPPYCRCSLLDAKAKERFAKLPLMYVQPKLDGSFIYLVKEAGKAPEAITRAGSKYPQWFADKLAEGFPDGSVLVGEALVIDIVTGKALPRQQGNGILNSALKGDEDKSYLNFTLTAWDLLTSEEFKAGKSTRIYEDRLLTMYDKVQDCANVTAILNHPVETLEEAYKIYSEHTARGEEGCVLKSPDSLWSNGTSKDMVKMKISFEIDLEITHVTEGTGKAKGMMGAVGVKSLEGILQSDVGTGWSDADRKHIWEMREQVIGGILTVKANDIISNRNTSGKSLFLPVAIELRNDKFVADTYEHCVAQLNAAKGL